MLRARDVPRRLLLHLPAVQVLIMDKLFVGLSLSWGLVIGVVEQLLDGHEHCLDGDTAGGGEEEGVSSLREH